MTPRGAVGVGRSTGATPLRHSRRPDNPLPKEASVTSALLLPGVDRYGAATRVRVHFWDAPTRRDRLADSRRGDSDERSSSEPCDRPGSSRRRHRSTRRSARRRTRCSPANARPSRGRRSGGCADDHRLVGARPASVAGSRGSAALVATTRPDRGRDPRPRQRGREDRRRRLLRAQDDAALRRRAGRELRPGDPRDRARDRRAPTAAGDHGDGLRATWRAARPGTRAGCCCSRARSVTAARACDLGRRAVRREGSHDVRPGWPPQRRGRQDDRPDPGRGEGRAREPDRPRARLAASLPNRRRADVGWTLRRLAPRHLAEDRHPRGGGVAGRARLGPFEATPFERPLRDESDEPLLDEHGCR